MRSGMTESKLFFGGMNVEGELKQLNETFGDAKPGDIIAHEAIEQTIGVSRNSSRYHTILRRWRRDMLKTRNLDIESRRGEGYAVLTPTERVSSGTRHLGLHTKAMKRTVYRVSTIPREQLDSTEAKTADHLQVLMAKMIDDMSTASRQIAPPKAHVPLVA